MNQPSYQDLWYAKEQSDRDALVNGYNSADKDVELASRDLADAQMRGDSRAIAEANARLSQATVERETLQTGLTNFDEQHPADARGSYQYQQPQQPQRQYTTTDIINSMGSLSARERHWLMQHQELVSTPAGQSRLQACYYDATERGIQRDSDEYFNYFNDYFGFNGNNGSNYSSAGTNTSQNYVVGGERVQRQYQQQGKPYTPETPKVNLTEEQAAKISGVDMATYKANQKKLRDLKALGYYADR
jgi:hypothetical protein